MKHDTLLELLESFRTIEWDKSERGFARPNDTATRNAKVILTLLQDLDFIPLSIGPCPCDGVTISFFKKGQHCVIECLNEGEFMFVMVSLNKVLKPVAWKSDPKIESLVESIKRIKSFIEDKSIEEE